MKQCRNLVLFFVVVLNLGCQSDQPSFIQGQRVFEVEPKSVSEIEMVRNNASLGVRWAARFQRDKKSQQWILAQTSEGTGFSDRLGNQGLLKHILSSISELRVVSSDIPQTEASFGLVAPQLKVTFVSGSRRYQIELGDRDSQGASFYSRVIRPDSQKARILLLKGSLFGLSEQVKNFSDLRDLSPATFSIHDVTEVEVFRGGRSIFFAQRVSGRWADRNLKFHLFNTDNWIRKALFLRADRMLDQPEEVKSVEELMIKNKKQLIRLRFSRRGAEPVDLKLIKRDQKYVAQASERKGTAFEFSSTAEKVFTPPKGVTR